MFETEEEFTKAYRDLDRVSPEEVERVGKEVFEAIKNAPKPSPPSQPRPRIRSIPLDKAG